MNKWLQKFANAFRGLAQGVRGQSSFLIHVLVAIAVVGLAFGFQLDQIRFCILILCITLVLTCELFNSSLEMLAKAITQQHNVHIGKALDIASGAVLMASIGSVIIGAIVFLEPLTSLLFN